MAILTSLVLHGHLNAECKRQRSESYWILLKVIASILIIDILHNSIIIEIVELIYSMHNRLIIQFIDFIELQNDPINPGCSEFVELLKNLYLLYLLNS